MDTAQSRAEKLFAGCFTKEQFEFLRSQPEFIEATRTVESLKETIQVVELGDQMLRQHEDGRDSALAASG